jgi:hypothetical protein
MDAVAAQSGFVAEAEPPVTALQPLEPMQRLRTARDLAQEAHFAAPARLGDATDVILLWTSNPTNVVASMRPVSYA